MKKLILLLFLIIFPLSAFQSTNKTFADTLDMYTHWGIIRVIDTVYNDTTYIVDDFIKTAFADLDSADIDNFIDDITMDSSLTVNSGYIANVTAQAYKSEYNISSQLGAYVHGIKVEHTRTANIQPATGGWFGGQFVLNSGTTAWDDVDKASYAVHGVIKGDQWDGSVDVNAGRFELQSSGSVRDIVYILANTGTAVSSSMLYMPTHISLPNAIQINAQSNSTITNGIDFVTGAGSQLKYGIDFSGATIDSADIRLSDGTTMPGYRSEARVDTFTTTYLFSRIPGVYGIASGTQSFHSWTLPTTYGHIAFNAAGEHALTPIELLADSVYMDSIAWHYGWYGTPPDADTVYFIYSDSTHWTNGFPVYVFTQIDTVGASEIVKDTYGQRLVMAVGKGYSLGALDKGTHYPRMGFEYEKETNSGAFIWTAIIIYYTASYKR